MINLNLPAGWDRKHANSLDEATVQDRCLKTVARVKEAFDSASDTFQKLDGSAADFAPAAHRVIALNQRVPGQKAQFSADLQFDSADQQVVSGSLRSQDEIWSSQMRVVVDGQRTQITSEGESKAMKTCHVIAIDPDGSLHEQKFAWDYK